MTDGVVMVDSEDRIRLHNPAILDHLDPGTESLSLSHFGDERMENLVNRMVSAGHDSTSFEVELRRHDEPYTLANMATLLRDPDGEVTGAVLVVRNITEAARLEKMKNDFISTTSHKLRTPLTSILGFASLLRGGKLRDKTTDDGEDFVSTAAEAIEEQSRYLRELIEKLLGFTGMEQGSLKLEKESVDIASLLEEASQAVQSRADSDGIRIRQEAVQPGSTVHADHRKALQVLTNLLENAVKFSPADTEIHVGADVAGDEVRLYVSDQGPGIPVDEQERIFEKFYQIDRDLTGQVEGVGLGLALCRNIVLAHDGRIEVESEYGNGSTFRVYLPAK
jgi:two-component system phosphate regulon sensor histidine kinase PhoR